MRTHYEQGRVLAIVGTLAASILLSGAAHAENIQITADRLAVRQGPGATHAKVGTAVKGKVYAILERKGPWIKIQFGEGGGWVHSKYTRKAGEKAPAEDTAGDGAAAGEGTHTVVPAKLNARLAAGTKARVVFHLTSGTKVTVAETKGVWSKITHKGRTGWVMAKYLTTGSVPPPRRVAPRRPAPRPAPRPAMSPAPRPAPRPAMRPVPRPAPRPAMRPSTDE